MTRYAESTTVSSDRSRAEIEKTLSRYGADGFLYGWFGQRAQVGFEMKGRRIRIELPLPDKNADEFQLTPSKKWSRTPDQIEQAYEQAVKQRWRALALVIKAKLEAVETGITTFEEEFLAHIVLPSGATTGAFLIPQIEQAYRTQQMPALLPGVVKELPEPEVIEVVPNTRSQQD